LLRRRRELARQSGRRREIEAELTRRWERRITLTPASTKGGYDEIYHARANGDIVAMVRVNSPFKTQNDPIGPRDPGVPLGPAERLDREWNAYHVLSASDRSPCVLWRTRDAIASTWVDWQRASHLLTRDRHLLWPTLERIIPAVSEMHGCGVTHLDLNLGNLLLEPDGEGAYLIDFEFGPVPWVTEPQQMAYDYLRLIDDCTKPRRGGKLLLRDPSRIARLLEPHVHPKAHPAPMGFAFDKLHRLAAQPDLLAALEDVFPRLREEAPTTAD
jgi:hypothetical protein